jgi:hypothetical protein
VFWNTEVNQRCRWTYPTFQTSYVMALRGSTIFTCSIIHLLGSLHSSCALDLLKRSCGEQTGMPSGLHENGKRIVFLEDSTARFQYLELAYYTVYGFCPDTLMPDRYVLDERGFKSWQRFYNASSDILNVCNNNVSSTEICVCSRSSSRARPPPGMKR